MDLGPYASYRLPPAIARAFRVTTAQELADGVEAQGALTPEAAREAEAAYDAWRQGDATLARTFLTSRAGLSDGGAEAMIRVLDGQRPAVDPETGTGTDGAPVENPSG